VEPGLHIPVVSAIPDPLSCFRDSKSEDFGFHKRKIVGFRNPESSDSRIRIPLLGAIVEGAKVLISCSCMLGTRSQGKTAP